jgi:soluble P-type ATPase
MAMGMLANLSDVDYRFEPEIAIDSISMHAERVDYAIMHQIPGRLRLRISRLGWDNNYNRCLQRLILKATAITESRINPAASSLIIHYPPASVSQSVILDLLDRTIQGAAQISKQVIDTTPSEDGQLQGSQSLGWSALSLAVAIAAGPLDLPFFMVGGCVIVASMPLWQRFGNALNQGQVSVDSLDTLWLIAQLIQGNGIASAIAPNLAGIAEQLRQNKLAQLEQELSVLFEQEDEKLHWLSDQQRLVPLQAADRERWIQSVEETQLIQQVQPVAQAAIAPTIMLSGAVALLTNDLGRASALLPLDLGVSLRGVTPLAMIAALTAAARRGVFIRNARTLETLAQIDTLIFTLESFQSFTAEELPPFLPTPLILEANGQHVELNAGDPSIRSIIQTLQSQSLDLHIVSKDNEEVVQTWATRLGIPANNVHTAAESETINHCIEGLRRQGRRIAWVDNTTSDPLTVICADVVISLAQGNFESQTDVVLHSHDLRHLSYSLELARHTLTKAYQSLTIATFPNFIAVGLGAVFGLDPIAAVLINGGSAILAELNSLSPLSKA